MSMSISGLGSGFDIESWVSSLVAVKKNSTVTPIENKISTINTQNSAVSALKTKYSALQSALQTFTKTTYDSSSDMWTNTKISSSESDYVTATSSGIVSASSVDVKVNSIATATVAKSYKSIGSSDAILDTEFTKLANGQATTGTFSLFVDNKKYQIEIEKGESLRQVLEKLEHLGEDTDGAPVLDINLQDGVLSIKPKDENASFVLGSSGDTSNIVSALKLYEKDGNGYKNKADYAISKVNTSVAMADSNSGIGAFSLDGDGNTGTIKINGAAIEINETTTINDLISKINSNSDAHVKASYDSLTNKFILTATQTGECNIALEEENTNLLSVLGLTSIDEETGVETLHPQSQTLGQNASVTINGNDIISSSNTISGATSGIANLSITIKKPTVGEDAPSSAKLSVESDYSKIKTALKTFVSAYNDVVSSTKSAIASDGSLSHDSSLQSILSNIKSVTTTSSENKGEFSVLSQIGISTSSSDPTQLVIDEKKLDEVLTNNLDSVKYLLSDGYTDTADTGLFDKLLKNVDDVLDTTNGYFSNKTQSLDSQLSLLNSRLERANKQLSNYETRVTAQFNRMDTLMSQLNSQLSTFQAYLGN